MREASEILDVAEKLLCARFGGQQKLTDPEDLGGSGAAHVFRVRLASSAFLQQRSVVVKYTPATGDPFDDAGLIREVVSYQFTTSLPVAVRPGPELIAYDIDQRILVIGDSGDGETYQDVLESADDAGRLTALRELGKALGRMHAGTAHREKHFDILLHRMLGRFPATRQLHDMRDQVLTASVDRGMALLRGAGIAIPQEVADFAQNAKRRVSTGRHRAFTPFDLSPDNILMVRRPVFLDYEWAGFRDATYDVACVIAGFPQFVNTKSVTDEEADAVVDAWVREVVDVWPNVGNAERLQARIITAMIGWAASSVAYLYYGSMNRMLQSLTAQQPTRGGIPDAQVQAAQTCFSESDDVLAGSLLSDMDEMGRLARRDLYETFEALHRYARRGTDPRFQKVAVFAADVLSRLNELGTE